MTDYVTLFGYGLLFWVTGFGPAYLMKVFQKGMEISV